MFKSATVAALSLASIVLIPFTAAVSGDELGVIPFVLNVLGCISAVGLFVGSLLVCIRDLIRAELLHSRHMADNYETWRQDNS